jgi:LysM repeat protein
MRLSPLLALATLTPVLLLVSCKSSSSKKPMKMPTINVSSTAAPPKHSLPRGEYPFDSQGNYVSAWAAEGEQRSGRAAVFGTDYSTWQSSHGGSTSRTSTPKKTTSSTSSRSNSSPPKKTTASSKPAKKPTPSKSSSVSHTVKSGDTLYGLALRYKSTVAKIKAANGLKSDVIRPGQTLRIPR